MGLDITHDCWHGPYSKFMRFRRSLCLQINIDIDMFSDYGGNGKSSESLDHDIMPLINHSDCDGRLTVKESRRIIKGLQSILDNFNKDLPMDYDFKDMIIQFKKGLELSVKSRQIVRFH